jgi:hypothetical protein
VAGTSSNTNYKPTTNTLSYDAYGRLTQQSERTEYANGSIPDRIRAYTYNAEGQVQTRRHGTWQNNGFQLDPADALGSLPIYNHVYAAGQQLAQLQDGGQTRQGTATSIGSVAGTSAYSAGGGMVAVQPGETLRTLAKRVYGNEQLWYAIADANGLSDSNADLIDGQQLKAPNVQVNTNDAGTFKPYDPSEAIGSTTPSLPYIAPPSQNGCGTIAMILMVVIAVVVTVYTAGAAAGAVGATTTATTTTVAGASVAAGSSVAATTAAAVAAGASASGAAFATGAAVLGGSFGVGAAVAAGVAGGIVGSVASQAVGSLAGVASFSWRNALVQGAVGGATAGIGAAANAGLLSTALQNSQVARAAVTAIAGNVTGYAANRALGNDVSFSWKSVAASAVSAAVSSSLSSNLTTGISSDVTRDFINGAMGSVASYATRRAFGFDEKFNSAAVIADGLSGVISGAARRPNTKSNYSGMSGQMKDGRLSFDRYLDQPMENDGGYSGDGGPDADVDWQYVRDPDRFYIDERGMVHDRATDQSNRASASTARQIALRNESIRRANETTAKGDTVDWQAMATRDYYFAQNNGLAVIDVIQITASRTAAERVAEVRAPAVEPRMAVARAELANVERLTFQMAALTAGEEDLIYQGVAGQMTTSEAVMAGTGGTFMGGWLGAKQLWMNVTGNREGARQVALDIADNNRMLDNLKVGNPAAVWGGFTAQASAVPLMVVTGSAGPLGLSGSMLGRVSWGAATGAASQLPVGVEGPVESYWSGKGAQVAMGGAFGVGGAALGEAAPYVVNAAARARARSLGSKNGMTTHGMGAAANPRMAPYAINPDGLVRTEAQAIDLARSHGVYIPDDIRPAFMSKWTRSDADAEYFDSNSGGRKLIYWEDFYHPVTGMIPVRFNASLLNSDEAIVAHFAHEMHELNSLRSIFEERGAITPQELKRLIAPGHARNLHEQAWDMADIAVNRMRQGGVK